MEHSAYRYLKNQEDHLQILLDLLQTYPSPCALSSTIFTTGTQTWTSYFTLPNTLPPYPASCPVLAVLCSLIQWVKTLLTDHQDACNSLAHTPQLQHTPPTLSIQPSDASPAVRQVEPNLTTLSRPSKLCSNLLPSLSTDNLLCSKLNRSRSGSLEGDPFQIGEEFVEKEKKK